MARSTPAVRAILGHEFGPLREIRDRPEAKLLWAQAMTFPELLRQEHAAHTLPLMVSVRAVRNHDS